MLQSANFGGEAIWGCSLSEGGWMDMQGGLIFFFLWPPPNDCTLTGKACPLFSHHWASCGKSWLSPATTACGRQTSIEWRRWSSGFPTASDIGLPSKPWVSTLKPFLKSRSFDPAASRLSVLLEDGGSSGSGGGGGGESREQGEA